MELKSRFCYTKEEVTRFINENHITKENIQVIVPVEEKHFVIFYWEQKKEMLNG
jgi:hypothetical protein